MNKEMLFTLFPVSSGMFQNLFTGFNLILWSENRSKNIFFVDITCDCIESKPKSVSDMMRTCYMTKIIFKKILFLLIQ